MPAVSVVFFQESEGSSDVVNWLSALRKSNKKAYVKCAARIQRLGAKRP
jgi:hypothetical protein